MGSALLFRMVRHTSSPLPSGTPTSKMAKSGAWA